MFFQVFQGKNEKPQADLKSASKISLTIREGFLTSLVRKNFFSFQKFYFFFQGPIFSKFFFSPIFYFGKIPRGWLS